MKSTQYLLRPSDINKPKKCSEGRSTYLSKKNSTYQLIDVERYMYDVPTQMFDAAIYADIHSIEQFIEQADKVEKSCQIYHDISHKNKQGLDCLQILAHHHHFVTIGFLLNLCDRKQIRLNPTSLEDALLYTLKFSTQEVSLNLLAYMKAHQITIAFNRQFNTPSDEIHNVLYLAMEKKAAKVVDAILDVANSTFQPAEELILFLARFRSSKLKDWRKSKAFDIDKILDILTNEQKFESIIQLLNSEEIGSLLRVEHIQSLLDASIKNQNRSLLDALSPYIEKYHAALQWNMHSEKKGLYAVHLVAKKGTADQLDMLRTNGVDLFQHTTPSDPTGPTMSALDVALKHNRTDILDKLVFLYIEHNQLQSISNENYEALARLGHPTLLALLKAGWDGTLQLESPKRTSHVLEILAENRWVDLLFNLLDNFDNLFSKKTFPVNIWDHVLYHLVADATTSQNNKCLKAFLNHPVIRHHKFTWQPVNDQSTLYLPAKNGDLATCQCLHTIGAPFNQRIGEQYPLEVAIAKHKLQSPLPVIDWLVKLHLANQWPLGNKKSLSKLINYLLYNKKTHLLEQVLDHVNRAQPPVDWSNVDFLHIKDSPKILTSLAQLVDNIWFIPYKIREVLCQHGPLPLAQSILNQQGLDSPYANTIIYSLFNKAFMNHDRNFIDWFCQHLATHPPINWSDQAFAAVKHPIWLALHSKDLPLFKSVLSLGKNISLLNQNKENILTVTIQENDASFYRHLLQSGKCTTSMILDTFRDIIIQLRQAPQLFQPLVDLLSYASTHQIKIPWNEEGIDKNTIFHALLDGMDDNNPHHLQLIKKAIAQGADVNLENIDGYNAVLFSCIEEKLNIFSMLLDNLAQDKIKQTLERALLISTFKHHNDFVGHILDEAKKRVGQLEGNEITYKGENALTYAFLQASARKPSDYSQSQIENLIFVQLLKAGIHPLLKNIPPNTKKSPKNIGDFCINDRGTDWLPIIEKYARHDAVFNPHVTLHQLAKCMLSKDSSAFEHWIDILKFYPSSSIPWKTPLNFLNRDNICQYAVRHNLDQNLEKLLNAGANPTVGNKSALELAVTQHKFDLVSMLLQKSQHKLDMYATLAKIHFDSDIKEHLDLYLKDKNCIFKQSEFNFAVILGMDYNTLLNGKYKYIHLAGKPSSNIVKAFQKHVLLYSEKELNNYTIPPTFIIDLCHFAKRSKDSGLILKAIEILEYDLLTEIPSSKKEDLLKSMRTLANKKSRAQILTQCCIDPGDFHQDFSTLAQSFLLFKYNKLILQGKIRPISQEDLFDQDKGLSKKLAKVKKLTFKSSHGNPSNKEINRYIAQYFEEALFKRAHQYFSNYASLLNPKDEQEKIQKVEELEHFFFYWQYYTQLMQAKGEDISSLAIHDIYLGLKNQAWDQKLMDSTSANEDISLLNATDNLVGSYILQMAGIDPKRSESTPSLSPSKAQWLALIKTYEQGNMEAQKQCNEPEITSQPSTNKRQNTKKPKV